ncbi:hypothetical protein DVH24_001672 [Malus domestica]|uniref:Uncharacterized protein n=1 Tax=Malus domestica TaxID=3750 RepID=A0A498I7J4_MALDO|nr:hypothetical protein DVH24_001672 [Malus domestica]
MWPNGNCLQIEHASSPRPLHPSFKDSNWRPLPQDVFKQNSYNRKKQKYFHKGGAKPFHPTCKEGLQGNEIKDKMKKKKDGVKGESIQEALEVVMVIFQMTMIHVLN